MPTWEKILDIQKHLPEYRYAPLRLIIDFIFSKLDMVAVKNMHPKERSPVQDTMNIAISWEAQAKVDAVQAAIPEFMHAPVRVVIDFMVDQVEFNFTKGW